jgi:hypothetical protein
MRGHVAARESASVVRQSPVLPWAGSHVTTWEPASTRGGASELPWVWSHMVAWGAHLYREMEAGATMGSKPHDRM